MRENIMVMGFEADDRNLLTKVFSEAYDLVFIGNAERLGGVDRGPFFKVVLYNMGSPDDANLLAFKEIKSQDVFERPIIVFTSRNTVEIDRFLASIGVFYHLVRPFEFKDLDDLIKGALRFWQKKRIDVPAPVKSAGQ
jgi:DNA-binding NtrC family response regulator